MRKGLLAVVVLAVLIALALMFWPREIEQGTPAPAGNASLVIPSAPLPGEDPGHAARAPERAKAPAPAEAPLAPPAADPAPGPSAPAGSAETAPPADALPQSPVVEPAAGDAMQREPDADDARDSAEAPGSPPEEAAPENPGTAAIDDAAEQLAALSPPDAAMDPRQAQPAAPAEEGAAAAADPSVPVLDLVRVAPDGQAVIAGQAPPRATVEILLDGVVVGSAEAGADGGFVAILETRPSSEPREMRLRVPRAARSAVTAPARATGAAHPGGPAAAPGFALSAPVVILPGADPAAAPVVVARGEREVDVVQPGAVEAPDRIALDRLTYATGGDLVAAGRGPGTRAIRTYADGRLVGEAPVGPDGEWRAVIPHDVAEDASLLRFDEIGGDGAVVSRLEAPFEYAEDGGDRKYRQRDVTIERGNNLWRIAEQHYGQGLRYSVIFQANAELIRNPDLIYPGQVFTIPELVEAE